MLPAVRLPAAGGNPVQYLAPRRPRNREALERSGFIAGSSRFPANGRLAGRADRSLSCQGWLKRSISSLIASFCRLMSCTVMMSGRGRLSSPSRSLSRSSFFS